MLERDGIDKFMAGDRIVCVFRVMEWRRKGNFLRYMNFYSTLCDVILLIINVQISHNLVESKLELCILVRDTISHAILRSMICSDIGVIQKPDAKSDIMQSTKGLKLGSIFQAKLVSINHIQLDVFKLE